MAARESASCVLVSDARELQIGHCRAGRESDDRDVTEHACEIGHLLLPRNDGVKSVIAGTCRDAIGIARGYRSFVSGCRAAMGIAGGLWSVKPALFCLFLGAAEAFCPRPVDGHSGPSGPLHALFPTAARRQSS